MTTAVLIFPHQLFAHHPALSAARDRVVLFEDPLFFGDPLYPARMHKQKLWLHRATMTRIAHRLREAGHDVTYVDYTADSNALQILLQRLAAEGVRGIRAADPVDFLAAKRLRRAADRTGLKLVLYDTPGFLNTPRDNARWTRGRSRWLMADYYKAQRKRLNVLMQGDLPAGGQWSFDEDNRKKVPKQRLNALPSLPEVAHDPLDHAARDWVEARFPDAPGRIDTLLYPTSHAGAEHWLDRFLVERFSLFGDYEDAIVAGENWLWHGVLTPILNIGLLTPRHVLEATLARAARVDVPLNSVEGFVRQLIGWREFMRATYDDLGVRMRTGNHWGHHRPMPACLYDGTTGIDPVDDVIARVLDTGYCHHIERLMVLGGFMFLCEIDPHDVYRWFMEMFVDSYDWVMVPNTYAMSQHADGGLITTKPYFSGSNYIRKMSHWAKGDWAEIWDGLYWRFIWTHRKALVANPRWAMTCRAAEQMDSVKMQMHLSRAEVFLNSLHAHHRSASAPAGPAAGP
ncbi:MAG: cryptochrome/photolyase family protein [Pseudomonadota bacterium]